MDKAISSSYGELREFILCGVDIPQRIAHRQQRKINKGSK
ncbi:hypothetical protein HNQ36_003096 [Afipia massiliensis]|uniref:Uncharacterized protein n=1 Tax=Afipia massiliensis TaxID=211460 RepID=A0A840MZ13_9BRAD|nr:hypothetical protein [Afipia massiliensis]